MGHKPEKTRGRGDTETRRRRQEEGHAPITMPCSPAACAAPERSEARPSAPAWIHVADRLPDDDITVIIHMPESDEPIWLGYHQDGRWWTVDALECLPLSAEPFPGEGHAHAVRHWMPLPEPPATAGGN